jgi:hypothetical protein
MTITGSVGLAAARRAARGNGLHHSESANNMASVRRMVYNALCVCAGAVSGADTDHSGRAVSQMDMTFRIYGVHANPIYNDPPLTTCDHC